MLAPLLMLSPSAAAFLGGASAGRATELSSSRSAVTAISMKGAPKVMNVGLVGGGTVGGGIVEILSKKADFCKQQLGVDIQFKKIVVGNPDKPRDFELPAGCELTGNVKDVTEASDIDLVVEVMGGTTLAKDVVTAALKAGKHVVTANKALIAQELPAIDALLKSVNADREEPVQFGFEAAVCGGIPIIHALQRDFIGDDVQQLSGIINGCTNFILSNMAMGGLSYKDALAEASALGYAEADPTLDVGGFDARSKLKIMMKLAFGIDVDEDEIPCRGIQEIQATDFEYAKAIGGTVKILGVAKVDPEDKTRISAFVSPMFVPEDSVLHNINGATNAVMIDSSSLQQSVFVGQGAGRYPTANSCVSDILAIAQGDTSEPFPKEAPSDLKFVNTFNSAFYVRIRFRDAKGIIASVGEIFAKNGASIFSILQNPIKDRNDDYFVVVTEPVSNANIKRVCVDLEASDWCLGETFYMPYAHAPRPTRATPIPPKRGARASNPSGFCITASPPPRAHSHDSDESVLLRFTQCAVSMRSLRRIRRCIRRGTTRKLEAAPTTDHGRFVRSAREQKISLCSLGLGMRMVGDAAVPVCCARKAVLGLSPEPPALFS